MEDPTPLKDVVADSRLPLAVATSAVVMAKDGGKSGPPPCHVEKRLTPSFRGLLKWEGLADATNRYAGHQLCSGKEMGSLAGVLTSLTPLWTMPYGGKGGHLLQ